MSENRSRIRDIEEKINQSKFAKYLVNKLVEQRKRTVEPSDDKNSSFRRPNPNITNGTQSKGY